MSLHGVGIDVADTRRVQRLLGAGSGRFAQRWFTTGERAQCDAADDPAVAYATRLAAKEAVWKALGLSGDSAVPWGWIEILDDGSTGVTVSLSGAVASSAAELGVGPVRVNWVVADEVATAVALAEQADA